MPLPRPSVASGLLRGAGVWRWLGLIALTSVFLLVLACLLALRVPVTFLIRNTAVPPAVVALHGSASEGQATLKGGYVLRWKSSLHVLPLPHLRSDLTLEGSDTRLNGWVSAGSSGLHLNTLEGRAGPGLAQIVPGAWQCDITARVVDLSFDWRWRSARAGGEISTPSGRCSKGSRETTLPPLTVTLGTHEKHATARVVAPGPVDLAEAKVSRDRNISMTIQPTAAEIFPVLPAGGPITLQIPF